MMTTPELANFEREVIQTAAVCVAILEDIRYGVADVSLPTGSGQHSQTMTVLMEIAVERERQDIKWGPQHHRVAEWLSILGEEYGEACKAANDDLLFPIEQQEERLDLHPPEPVKWRTDRADRTTELFDELKATQEEA